MGQKTSARAERLEARVLLAAGVPDETFGPGGMRALDFGGVGDSVYDAAVQRDGKVIVVGDRAVAAGYGQGGDVVVMRMTAGGEPDPTFGEGGRAVVDFGWVEHADAVEVQSSGKIVVGGWVRFNEQLGWEWLVFRLNADGTLDDTFGTGGRTILPFSDAGGDDKLYDLAIQPDGKIMGAGSATVGAPAVGLARLDANGHLDNTFGDAGMASPVMSRGLDAAYAVAVQADGKVWVAGTSDDIPSAVPTLAMARFKADGTIDPTFTEDGWMADDLGSAAPSSLALSPDGGLFVVVTAVRGSGAGPQMGTYLRKYSGGGSRAVFGTSGGVLIAEGGVIGVPASLFLQSDGKPVVAATSGAGGASAVGRTTVARLKPDGTFDPTFAVGGKLVLGEGQHAAALTMDYEGRFLVVGNDASDGRVWRVGGDPSGSVRGRLYEDFDGDQIRDATEKPAVRIVFIDADRDGVQDQHEIGVITDSDGSFRFDRLTVLPGGADYAFGVVYWTVFWEFGWSKNLTASVGSAGEADLGEWGICSGYGVTGRVFVDSDGNGAYDAGEPGVAGARVYVDGGDGQLGSHEWVVETRADGTYSIATRGTGQYRIQQALPVDHRQVWPVREGGHQVRRPQVGSVVSGINFIDAPSVMNAEARYDPDTGYLLFQFDRNVVISATLEMRLVNQRTGYVTPFFNRLNFLGDSTRKALQPAPGVEPGRYSATLKAGSYFDFGGNPLPHDISWEFEFLPGDANQNGRIDAGDYFAIDRGRAMRLQWFTNGDFNRSGGVANADDYIIIDRAFLAQQQAPAGGAAPLAPPSGVAPMPDSASPSDEPLWGASADVLYGAL